MRGRAAVLQSGRWAPGLYATSGASNRPNSLKVFVDLLRKLRVILRNGVEQFPAHVIEVRLLLS